MREPVSPASPFDYQALESETRGFVLQKTDETHGLLKRTTEHILHIGQNLKAVKEKLPHGQFLHWLATEFGLSRWSAQRFMQVADRLESTWETVQHLPISVLYEVAAPSTSQEIVAQVEQGQIAPTLVAVRAAKEAERLARAAEEQAREEAEVLRTQQRTLGEEFQTQRMVIADLTAHITRLQERVTELYSPAAKGEEANNAEVEHLHTQVQMLIQERETLRERVAQLAEEARTAAQRQREGEQERRVRLAWYKSTNEFQASVTKLLTHWPSPLDTLAFEADDWTRLAHTQGMVQRMLKACIELAQARIVEGSRAPREGEER